jgi:uncharacterized protein (TIGR02594 family)
VSILQRYLGGREAAGMNAMSRQAEVMSGTEAESQGGERIMRLAGAQLGMDENQQNAALKDYLQTGGQNLDPKSLAWCAAYANSTLQQAGYKGTGSNMARSFLEWGQDVDPGKAARGDLAVFGRGDPNGPYGHVGFIDQINPDGTIRLLAGNQGDKVSYANYNLSDALGVRRPSPMSTYARG